MESADVNIVLSTLPNEESASHIARELVEKKLAACCNIIPRIRSIYAWEDRIEDEGEVLILIKTTSTGYSKLEKKLLSIHPYKNPEILALDVKECAEKYLSWIISETGASTSS